MKRRANEQDLRNKLIIYDDVISFLDERSHATEGEKIEAEALIGVLKLNRNKLFDQIEQLTTPQGSKQK